MDRFPLPADAAYSYARNFSASHKGTDIMAPLGTPVLAVERGVAWSNIEPKGGKVVYLDSHSGRRYFYGHLSEWALRVISATQAQPLEVEPGDELGKVGNTGNAEGRAPHVHFQMRPNYHRGLEPVDPYDALAAVDPLHRGRGGGGGGGAIDGRALLAFGFLWWLSTKG